LTQNQTDDFSSELKALPEDSAKSKFDADSYIIDLIGVQTKTDLHQRISSVLKFPDYYGNNLDALFDILCDEHPFWDITFTSCKEAEERLGNDFFESFKQTFADAAEENSQVKVQFL